MKLERCKIAKYPEIAKEIEKLKIQPVFTQVSGLNTIERAKINPDGSLGKWELMIPTMQDRRYIHSSIYTGGYIYVMGGHDRGSGGALNSVEHAKVKNDGGEFKSVEVVKKINLSATDTTSLLIDFLSEALTYSQEERAVFTKVLFSDLDEKNIAAEIYGQTVDDFGEDIKAVTYHEANVVKNNRGNWETVIIFDI